MAINDLMVAIKAIDLVVKSFSNPSCSNFCLLFAVAELARSFAPLMDPSSCQIKSIPTRMQNEKYSISPHIACTGIVDASGRAYYETMR